MRQNNELEVAMSFWLAAILLTALAVASVLVPLTRRQRGLAGATANDLEVYRDQLSEIDRDAERGLIGTTESEEARAEIGRRILRLAKGETGTATGPGFRASRAVALAAVLSVPLVSWGLYGLVGSPDLPSQPLAARLATDPAKAPIDELVARAEAHLQANPDDGRGWEVLAPVYFRLGRYPDAVNAYSQAIKLDGATAARESGLGEAIAAASGGLIAADAQEAFRRALALEPGEPKAQFYLASALAQQGQIAEAAAAWKAMRQGLPADSPWLGAVDQALAEADRRLAGADQAPPPGLSRSEVDAAADMSAEDRNAMIAGMVAKLDERLKQNPRDPEGWQRLVRSYVVLGKKDEARDALARGLAALGEESPEAATLQAFAESLGLPRAQ
jgi:cytochrome c-type biogenesis protein CcmH